MRIAGALMVQAGEEVMARARAVAAHALGAKPREIAYNDGLFSAPQPGLGIFLHVHGPHIGPKPLRVRRGQAYSGLLLPAACPDGRPSGTKDYCPFAAEPSIEATPSGNG
jgi:hypothetical protein